MSSRNQNKPPITPSNKKEGLLDEIPLDKRRKIGPGKMVGQTGGGTRSNRQAFADVSMRSDPNNNNNNNNGSSDCGGDGIMQFTKEDVESLLNEKMKGKNKFDYKGKCEQMTEYIKRLRLCMKWFQELEERYVVEQEKLRNLLESADRKCIDLEVQMKNKIDELETLIGELRRNSVSLEERLAKVESEKMVAVDSYNSEKEAKAVVEKMHASLADEFERAQQDLQSANHRIESLNATYRNSQEYNTSLQQYNSRLQMDCETYKRNLERLEQEKSVILEDRATLRGRYNLLQDEISSFRDSRDEALKQRDLLNSELGSLRMEVEQAKDVRDRQQLQVQNLKAELDKYKEFTGKSSTELGNLTVKSNALEETCSSQREEIRILQHQLAAATEKLKMADLTTLETRTEYESQNRLVEDLQNRLADAEFQIVEAEKLRKKLHNTILELKGNIRVFCRVRPMLPDDGASAEASVICYPTSTESLGRGIDLLQNGNLGQKHQFTFDKVFTQESSQQDVFVEISQLVQSALDGYKVCIFAYGQTGSGKTFTMMGRPETPEQKGLIPRSLEQIFQCSQSLVSQGWKYKMQASMLEIYNETIRDLLSTNRAGSVDNSTAGRQYTIKHDVNGNTHVSDLTVVDVCSLKEVSSLLHQAAQSRSVGKTQMNEQSSRSHFVFTLRIYGVNESTEQQVHGILNLIDLAGSERLSKSGSTGDRLKETQAISKSLSSLSDVIFSLAMKEDHVPFRNSKLAFLLQREVLILVAVCRCRRYQEHDEGFFKLVALVTKKFALFTISTQNCDLWKKACFYQVCRKCIYKKLTNEEADCCPLCDAGLGCTPIEKLRADHNLQEVKDKIFPSREGKVTGSEVIPSALLDSRRKERSLSSLGISTPHSNIQLSLPRRRMKAAARMAAALRGSNFSSQDPIERMEGSLDNSPDTLNDTAEDIIQGQCRKLTVRFRISLMEWAKRVLALYKIVRLLELKLSGRRNS